MRYSVIVPTLNGGSKWISAAQALSTQQPAPNNVLVIDSGSQDRTVDVARSYGFSVQEIDAEEFDHGGTRQSGVEASNTDIIVFLTQDAYLASEDAVARLVTVFANPSIGAAYGRQITPEVAPVFEQHARSYNYPAQDTLKDRSCVPEMGIKTAFCSNSFAAYRKSALVEAGGFPCPSIFAEDMYVAAKILLDGLSIAYVAEAICEHWHEYSAIDEFQRAFDIGVFHSREHWILEKFGGAQGQGGQYIKSSIGYIYSRDKLALPGALLKYVAKMSGYLLGRRERYLPNSLKKRISLNRQFWNTNKVLNQ